MDKLFISTGLLKYFKLKNASVDCAVFKLHYKLTAVALLAASAMVSFTTYFGNPIECITSEAKLKKFIETFCWIESTYSLPKAFDKEVGVDVVYPGVDNSKPGDAVVEHAYYQWVCMLLFLQCMLFVLPHIIWKTWEGGKIKQLLMELDKPIIEKSAREDKFKTLSDYFFMRGTGHRLYFTKYIICECLNFINVIGQIYLMDKFLHEEFTTYGTSVVNFINKEQEDRVDPMVRVFPRMTKCSFYFYGPSGDVQAQDIFCILPLNILNEKIFVFAWFWFVILSVLTAISLAIKFLMLAWPHARTVAIKYACLILNEDVAQVVLDKCSVGDWWVLYLLAKSMDKVNYKEFMESLAVQAAEME